MSSTAPGGKERHLDYATSYWVIYPEKEQQHYIIHHQHATESEKKSGFGTEQKVGAVRSPPGYDLSDTPP